MTKFMKSLIPITTFFLLISCAINPTEKQKTFAISLKDKPGIIDASWDDSWNLYVTVDLDALGSNPKLKAQDVADQIADKGLKDTQQTICVTIYYGNHNRLADSCRKW
ncbi:MAG: hypothetical protein ACRENZ_02750 [Thermodesulfobacteriota bacterium]